MSDIKYCRDCKQWHPVGQWQGRCPKYYWNKPKWSESATAENCPDYNRPATQGQMYQVAPRKIT